MVAIKTVLRKVLGGEKNLKRFGSKYVKTFREKNVNITFELKLHIFSLGTIPENINAKKHNLLRDMLTAARSWAQHFKK